MKNLWSKIVAFLARPFAYLGGEWGRMAPRERRLVGVLAGVLAGVLLVVASWLYFDQLSTLAEHNQDLREALASIAKNKDVYQDAKAKVRAQEVRIGKAAPQLLADLEEAARAVGVTVSEQNERPGQAAARNYMQHEVDLRLRGVDLLALSKFLQKVETGPRLILVTRLETRKRFSEADKLDVDLTATAYEWVPTQTAKKRGGKS